MPRGLDHIVHAVRDLDRAGVFYERLGFTVGARNRHPWGTHNRIVQFPGVFIELLTFAEPDKLGSDGLSRLFAAYNRDFVAAHEGLSMLILESTDAAADVREFERAGIAGSAVLPFEREGRRPDGSRVKLGFSLAFAEAGDGADVRFATCQQHFPENFWNPAFQRHPNGARGVTAVTLVAADPQEQRSRLMAFTGATEAQGEGTSYRIPLPRGTVAVQTPDGFAAETRVEAPGSGLRLAAMTFAVADLTDLRDHFAKAGVSARSTGEAVVVAPQDAMGATLLFTTAR